MNDILKQRLVGALVIVVLAVIFWPMVFVGPEGEPLDRTTQVPSIPSLKRMQLDAPEPLQGIAPVERPSSAAGGGLADAVVMEPAETVAPSLEENFEPDAEASLPLAEGSPSAAEGSLSPAEGSLSPAEGSLLSPAEGSLLSPAEGSLLSPAEGSRPLQEQAAETEQAPRLDERGIPIAWTLQVVSVGKQEKAEMLVRELMEMRYKAYFKAVSHGDGTLYRVYTGPKFERGKVEAVKLVVDKKFRVNSIVTRYLP